MNNRLVFITFVAFILLALAFPSPASAEPELTLGKTVFNAQCVTCYKGRDNLVVASKDLKKVTLEKYTLNIMENTSSYSNLFKFLSAGK